jgi:hypothetical protein
MAVTTIPSHPAPTRGGVPLGHTVSACRSWAVNVQFNRRLPDAVTPSVTEKHIHDLGLVAVPGGC